MTILNEAARIRRTAKLIEAEVDGELMGLDPDTAEIFAFNDTALRVWRLLDEPRTFGAICDQLGEAFDVTPDQCRHDVAALLETMIEGKLVAIEA